MAKFIELKTSSIQKFTKSTLVRSALSAELNGWECGAFTAVRILKNSATPSLWDVAVLWENACKFDIVCQGHETLEDAKRWAIGRSDKSDQLDAMDAANEDAFWAAHPHLDRI